VTDRWLRIASREAQEWGREQERLQAVLAARPDLLEQRIAERIQTMPTPVRPFTHRPVFRILAVAAAAALALGIWIISGDADSPAGPELVTRPLDRGIAVVDGGQDERMPAKLEASGMFAGVLDASWAGDPPHPQPGFAVNDRQYQLETGLVEIQVEGAKLVLEGPAKFRLTHRDRLEMQWGRATVSVDEGDFLVSTPSVDVVDLGTVFSVETSPGGDTEVHVLVGEVAAVPSGQGRDLTGAIALQAGSAGVFREWQPLDQEPQMPSEPIRFATSVQPAKGIRQLRGLVRAVAELPSMDRTWTNRNDVLIRLEKQGLALPEKLAVTRRKPGRYVGGREGRAQPIARGAIVNSYLLQLGPGDWVDERRAEAVVSFDGEIIGIIADDAGITDSDATFAEAPLDLRERGLTDTDEVHISEDGRSLYVDMRTVGVKQLRVLTASE
jgi:hypothetical protein